MFTKIVVAYDDSPGAQRALEIAVGLASQNPAETELLLVAVEAPLPHYGATVGEVEAAREFEETRCQRWVEAGEAYADRQGVTVSRQLRAGHPAQEVLRAAQTWDADLVVLGHSGHSGVWGRFLGSTAEKVSRHAHCSVLIAAPPEGRHGE